MEFAKELYPTYEEAFEAVMESSKLQAEIDLFLRTVDTGSAPKTIEEAGKTLVARLEYLFNREKNRAKDCGDEDAHADAESA